MQNADIAQHELFDESHTASADSTTRMTWRSPGVAASAAARTREIAFVMQIRRGMAAKAAQKLASRGMILRHVDGNSRA